MSTPFADSPIFCGALRQPRQMLAEQVYDATARSTTMRWHAGAHWHDVGRSGTRALGFV